MQHGDLPGSFPFMNAIGVYSSSSSSVLLLKQIKKKCFQLVHTHGRFKSVCFSRYYENAKTIYPPARHNRMLRHHNQERQGS